MQLSHGCDSFNAPYEEHWLRALSCILLLALLVGSQPLYGTESLRLFILGNDVGQLACKWSDNDVFVQAGEWLKVLPVKIEFMDSERLLIRREDGKRIELRANAQDVLIDGEIGKIEPAVTSVDGELFIPLKAFCGLLNLPFSFDAVNKVGYICAALLPVEVKQVEDGWRIEIPFTANTSYSINRLSGPERIYIDAANCLVSSQMHGEVIGRKGSIERIRVGQYSLTPPTARVVLDTDVKLGFQDITVKDAQGKTQRVVLFVRDLKVSKAGEARAKVSAVKLEPTNGIVRGLISVEGALRYRAFTLRDPYRIVIDFRGTELALPIGTQEIPKNEMVKEVRVGNPEVDGELVARVVFELFKPVRYRVIEKQAGGGLAVELGASSLSGVSIVIDPGHGGQDPGAISPTGMFKSKLVEKELTLDIALKLHKLLTNAGAIVTMTRYGDYYVSLEDRVYIANKLNPAAFVSIHLNSFPTPGAKSGTETYYFTPQSELLAGAIHKNLVATLGLPDNGIRQRRFYVLRNTNVPAVLIEACYLNHPVDGALVMDEQFREKIALAIFNGLEEYFSSR